MVSNQVLQNTIEGIKEISHLELGIMDSDGREVAVTAPVFAVRECGECDPGFREFTCRQSVSRTLPVL